MKRLGDKLFIQTRRGRSIFSFFYDKFILGLGSLLSPRFISIYCSHEDNLKYLHFLENMSISLFAIPFVILSKDKDFWLKLVNSLNGEKIN